MLLEQQCWTSDGGWADITRRERLRDAQLVFLFGSTENFAVAREFETIRAAYPGALLFGCSTAGEICGTRVLDDSLVATAVQFSSTRIASASVALSEVSGSRAAGAMLASALPGPGLIHALVLSDGQSVNGSELVRGITENLPRGVHVTGGLAGDGPRFERTFVIAKGEPMQGVISILGLYGDALRVGFGSLGGWDPFGPERLVTRSKANVLYELDGKPALELYKRYLGAEHVDKLPAAALLFPLAIRTGPPGTERDGSLLVRTVLSIDEREQSMTFAGDVPEGVYARLMKANFERLIDGAYGAARNSAEVLAGARPDLAILISCVGRKLVLKQRTEEEVEGVESVLGGGTMLSGFYSYGEICPAATHATCELHNQTMTITTFSEREP
jgi:hypothetical protein